MRNFALQLRIIVALMIVFMNGQSTFAGPKEDGWAAFDHGDYQSALKYWRPLAEKGNANLSNNIGVMYRDGLGVAVDGKEAVKWFQGAARKGFAQAQNNLGAMYLHGNGVQRSPEEAVKWFRLAAKKGLDMAQHNLGEMYHEGLGVATDNVKALMWYELAGCSPCGTEKIRETLRQQMTSAQITKAERLANRCRKSNYVGCD